MASQPPPHATAQVVVAPPPRVRLSEWVSIAGLIIVLIGMIWAGGGYLEQIHNNTRRIETLEASDKQRTDTLTQIDVRTARIEAKLEVMLPEKERAR